MASSRQWGLPVTGEKRFTPILVPVSIGFTSSPAMPTGLETKRKPRPAFRRRSHAGAKLVVSFRRGRRARVGGGHFYHSVCDRSPDGEIVYSKRGWLSELALHGTARYVIQSFTALAAVPGSRETCFRANQNKPRSRSASRLTGCTGNYGRPGCGSGTEKQREWAGTTCSRRLPLWDRNSQFREWNGQAVGLRLDGGTPRANSSSLKEDLYRIFRRL